MRLVTYSVNGSVSCGILADSEILDIPSNFPVPNPPRSIKQVLELWPGCLKNLAELQRKKAAFVPLDSVKLLAPIPRPGKVIALAGNYAGHIKEAGLALGLSDSPRDTTVPRPFLMPPSVVTGPDEQIPWPDYSEQIDYELELAVVIGKKAKYIYLPRMPPTALPATRLQMMFRHAR